MLLLFACSGSDVPNTGLVGPDSADSGRTGQGPMPGADSSADAPVSTGAGDAGSRSEADASSAANGDAGHGSADGSLPGVDAQPPMKLKTVFTIVMENHDYNEIVGSPNAPYFNSLIAAYGLATNYKDSGSHPSLPNYLTMVSGATQYGGVIDLAPTTLPFPVNAQNLGGQLQAKGIAWRAYSESMGAAGCRLSPGGNYVPKHDPFLYFTDVQNAPNGLCAKTNVDYKSFAADVASGSYRFMWIAPNLVNDGHDPALSPVVGLKGSDAWAKIEIPKLMASAAYLDGGVIFLTWDEAVGRNGNSSDQVPMIIISPLLKSPGFRSATAYSHVSYLATVEDILGVPRLDTVKTEPSMMEFFQ